MNYPVVKQEELEKQIRFLAEAPDTNDIKLAVRTARFIEARCHQVYEAELALVWKLLAEKV